MSALRTRSLLVMSSGERGGGGRCRRDLPGNDVPAAPNVTDTEISDFVATYRNRGHPEPDGCLTDHGLE